MDASHSRSSSLERSAEFVIALVATYIVRESAARWGLIDMLAKRKVHATPTPRGGRLAVWLGVRARLAVAQLVLWS